MKKLNKNVLVDVDEHLRLLFGQIFFRECDDDMSREGNVAMSNGVVEAPRRRTVHFTIGKFFHPKFSLNAFVTQNIPVNFPLVNVVNSYT